MSDQLNTNIDIGPLIAKATEVATGNLKDFLHDLKDDERKTAEKCVKALSEQMLKLALCSDEEEKTRIRATIEHWRGALTNIKGSAQYRAYHVILATITDVVAAIGAGLLKALI